MSNQASTFEWEADLYHRVSCPQLSWGTKVLGSLSLRGDERVLDVGCGTGLVTALLLERIPRGSAVALDASASMLEIARHNLARFGDRVAFEQRVLARDALPTGFDLVFSTATFHWVHDHDALFQSLGAALVAGGKLHAQCGGMGNLVRARACIDEVLRLPAYAGFFADMREPWRFAGVDETLRRLTSAGFHDATVWLSCEPTPFNSPPEYEAFMRSSVLPPYLACLPATMHAEFLAEVTARAAADEPALTLDYVRLNMHAQHG